MALLRVVLSVGRAQSHHASAAAAGSSCNRLLTVPTSAFDTLTASVLFTIFSNTWLELVCIMYGQQSFPPYNWYCHSLMAVVDEFHWTWFWRRPVRSAKRRSMSVCNPRARADGAPPCCENYPKLAGRNGWMGVTHIRLCCRLPRREIEIRGGKGYDRDLTVSA